MPLEQIKKRVNIYSDDVMEACKKSHAIVVCTEWDCFKNYDYTKIYETMNKPASLFDGRLILDHEKLLSIGFNIEAIGKRFEQN